MQTATAFSHKKMNPYLVNEINTATPEQLLIKVYDFAIVNCVRKDMLKTNDAIQVLINGLNFEHPAAKEISTGLLRLYLYCQDQMRKNNIREVQKILTELKETWITAFKNR